MYIGKCIHCSSPMFYDEDMEKLHTTSDDEDCLCEVERKETMTDEKRWRGKVENCDICGDALDRLINKQWFVDGRLAGRGAWALMCAECFEHYGTGIGTGCGQKYDAQPPYLKLEG